MIDLVICQGGQSGRFYILRIQHQLRYIASSINCPNGPIWLFIHLRLSVCWKYQHSYAITPSLLDNCINHWCWLVKYISTYGCVLSHCILVTSHLFSLVPSETCLYVNLFTSGKYLVFYPGQMQVNSNRVVKCLILRFTTNWYIIVIKPVSYQYLIPSDNPQSAEGSFPMLCSILLFSLPICVFFIITVPWQCMYHGVSLFVSYCVTIR